MNNIGKVYYKKRYVGPEYARYPVFGLFSQVCADGRSPNDEYLFTVGDESQAYQICQRLNKAVD